MKDNRRAAWPRITRRGTAALAAVLMVALVPASPAGADDPEPWLANYHGEVIDLNEGWGGALACTTDGSETNCFDSEAEMDEWMGEDQVAGRANCATSLRLYDFGSYGTPVLAVATRGIWVNLGSFDNRTTSYKVGACDTLFAGGANGSGGLYPGSTSAGVQSPSMVAGWDNAVSSIYIY